MFPDYSLPVAAPFDESDFVDTDFQAARKAVYPPPSTVPAQLPNRPPTSEELDARVGATHQKLAELRRQQEALEQERTALEEARRRRTEFQVGREEMLQHLTRGVGLLEEAEFTARRDAEQMAKTLGELRDQLTKVQALDEQTWTQEGYQVELTRSLTTLENARMEWNAAQLKWPLLSASPPTPAVSAPSHPDAAEWLASLSWKTALKLGLALPWPLVVVALLGLGVLALAYLGR
mgnify:CR=1 FL=1